MREVPIEDAMRSDEGSFAACEPCVVIQRYANRPILRALVHRGGLRADILSDGMLRAGDAVIVGAPR